MEFEKLFLSVEVGWRRALVLDIGSATLVLHIGYILSFIDYWLSVIRYSLLVIGFWLLVVAYRLFAINFYFLFIILSRIT